MALAVTIAYAGKVQAPSKEVVDTDLIVEKKKDSPPPRELVKEDLHIDDDDDKHEEEIVEREPEPEVRVEEPRRHFSLEINANFGRSLGCIIPNCGAFVPVQRICGGIYVQGYANQCVPPGYRPVVYQNVYVHEQPNNFQMQGYCPCVGQMGCGCGAQTPVLMVNNVQPIMPPRIGWDGVNGRTIPVWGPQPQEVFVLPQQQNQHLGPRQGGFIPREGFAPTSGMMMP
jgi:hypothetical protein